MGKKQGDAKTMNAFLTQDISYQKDGHEIVVAKNTAIVVDIDRAVALIGEDHVDIFADEYEVLVG